MKLEEDELKKYIQRYYDSADYYYRKKLSNLKDYKSEENEIDYYNRSYPYSEKENFDENYYFVLRMTLSRYMVLSIAISGILIISTDVFLIMKFRNILLTIFLIFSIIVQLYLCFVYMKEYLDFKSDKCTIKEFLKIFAKMAFYPLWFVIAISISNGFASDYFS